MSFISYELKRLSVFACFKGRGVIETLRYFFELSFKCFKKLSVAGWSSPVARQAHNLKVVGSNPTPATNN